MTEPRVSPPRIFPTAARSPRPSSEVAGAADAHRQTGFVLGRDLELVVEGLNLEGAVAQASSAAKFRKQPMVAGLGLWSRGWLSRLEACHAAECGSYGPAVSLVRAAADYFAAELLLLETGAAEWNDWLSEPAIALVPEEHATLYRLHPFRAAEVLARHEALAGIYRAASDLSMPHFGSTLLLAGSDSTPDRVLMTFGDRDFHLGMAELVFGWLLGLGVAKHESLLAGAGPYHVPEPAQLDRWVSEARRRRESRDRCRVVPHPNPEYRYAVENWRRTPGGAPKRVLL